MLLASLKEAVLRCDDLFSAKLRMWGETPALERITKIISQSGDSWFVCGGLLVVWFFARGALQRVLAYWGLAIAGTAFFILALKACIGRVRPKGLQRHSNQADQHRGIRHFKRQEQRSVPEKRIRQPVANEKDQDQRKSRGKFRRKDLNRASENRQSVEKNRTSDNDQAQCAGDRPSAGKDGRMFEETLDFREFPFAKKPNHFGIRRVNERVNRKQDQVNHRHCGFIVARVKRRQQRANPKQFAISGDKVNRI